MLYIISISKPDEHNEVFTFYNKTEAGVQGTLRQYAEEDWGCCFGDEDLPEKDDDIVQRYFDTDLNPIHVRFKVTAITDDEIGE